MLTSRNHDSRGDSAIFVRGGVDEDSQAWAQQMVDGGIVTDDLGFSYPSASGGPSLSQSQFFAETGYYVKRVDPSDRLVSFIVPSIVPASAPVLMPSLVLT